MNRKQRIRAKVYLKSETMTKTTEGTSEATAAAAAPAPPSLTNTKTMATPQKTKMPQSEPELFREPPSPAGFQHPRGEYTTCAPPTKGEEEKKEEEDDQSAVANAYYQSNQNADDSVVSTTFYGTEGSVTTASIVSSSDRTRASANTVSRTNTTKPKPGLDNTEASFSAHDLHADSKLMIKYVDEEDEKGGVKVVINKKEKEDEIDDETYYKEQNTKRREERKLGCYMFLSGLVGVIIASVLLALELPNNESPSSALNQTGQPSSDSTPALLELLDLPPSTLEILRSNPQSPQGQAFAWLRQDPYWVTDYDQQRARQRYGLSILYYATRGEEWHWDDTEAYGASFLSYDIHECDWMPHKASFGCDSSEHITSLGLQHMGLQGSLPKELWTVLAPNTLTKIELGRNQITGTIETYIGMLSQLTHLDLSQTQLNTSLPSEIGACQYLEILVLSDNPAVHGNLPTELGLLNNLQGLWWMNSGISGPIPSELGGLSMLQLLELGGNALTGTIPPVLFSGSGALPPDLTTISTSRSSPNSTLGLSMTATGLREIRLDRNQLVGSIPSEIVRVASSLTNLDLSQNNFERATFPTFLAALTKLTSLQVRRNQWTGAIPSELGLLSLNLASLGLSESKYTGPIPSEIMQLTNLRNLYLHNIRGLAGHIVDDANDITPDISFPFAVGLLTNLREFTISNTPLSGTIPLQLCTIPILSFSCNPNILCGCDCDCPGVTIAPNILTTGKPTAGPTVRPTEKTTMAPSISVATIRESILRLLPSFTRAAIEEYPQGPQANALEWLQDDPYVGTYQDSQRIRRFTLATLYLSLYAPDELSLENNWLVYETHECFWLTEQASMVSCLIIEGELQVTSLVLDVPGTGGTLPAELVLLASLKSFHSSGALTGNLPTELGFLSNLRHLELNRHQLQGSLPSEVGKCTSLITLKLSGSDTGNLNGTLPSELNALTQLEVFDISRNTFTGRLPETLPGPLQVLDLSHNKFVGTVPIASWALSPVASSLERFHFHHNSFRGNLVTQIGSFSQLTSLQLTRSHLSGNLPTELGFLSRLSVFDASWNKFSGHIPTWLGQLTTLRALHLNDNSFRGGIASEVGLMTNLEQLLLHDNDMISGRIPRLLTTLPLLDTFTVNKTFVAGLVPAGLCALNHFNFTCSAWLCGCESCACP